MKKSLGIILFVLAMMPVLGQKTKTASGNISVLAGEKELSVSFSYDNIRVQGYASEEDFIVDKVRKRNEHKPGSGEKFRASWFADRDTVYEPSFIERLNYAIPKKRKINVSRSNPNATYNLHVQTLWVYPGYSVGFSSPAKIEVVLQLYEVAEPKNIIWESKLTRIKAKVAPYKRELRIGAAYAALAIDLSWLLKKKAK